MPQVAVCPYVKLSKSSRNHWPLCYENREEVHENRVIVFVLYVDFFRVHKYIRHERSAKA